MRAAHMHFMVTHRGYETLVTHIFVEGDERLDKDAVFGVKPSLIRDFEAVVRNANTGRTDGREPGMVQGAFDIVLAPKEA